MKKVVLLSCIILSIIFFILLLRNVNSRELDDVSPEIPCNSDLYKKADILWIIPNLNNEPISENRIWCDYILSLNKTIELHGLAHDYNEFDVNRSEEYLEDGIKIFEDCFHKKPTMFKPPQLRISGENRKIIYKKNLKLKAELNQITRKVYHCNDTGIMKNKWIDSI